MASSIFIWPGFYLSFSGTVGAIDALAFDRANQDVYLARVGTTDLGIYTGGTNGVGGTLRFDVSASQITGAVPIVGPFGTSSNVGLGISANDGWYGSSGVVKLSLAGAANSAVFTAAAASVSGTFTFSNAIMSGKATTYANVVTAGWGVPAIQAQARTVGATAAVASVAAYTVGAADGSFEVSCNVLVTTSTLHTFTVTCAYTDESNTGRTLTLNISQITGVFVTAITNTTGAGAYEGVPMHIRCKAATTITIATAAGGTYTTVTYNVEGMIKQVA
jgi:hypothetical protein